ncbi:uncharacterized protein LOC126971865 isoform X1 [Leptidea sinapis]|uniref:uncharacterized protein LOC126971865 isoform X1 n=1 Tax=Leptidea sinapis TaxID=189913 RepID=UPI0021437593|nr:uncharacterized protein LOC126971865 isoform X1 [Leptidea sinapis]
MTRTLYICLVLAAVSLCYGVSTKVDFDEYQTATVANDEDDNVEVKHTIVVSTKLRNNNYRRGLHGTDNPEFMHQNKPKKEDIEEVPIVKAFKSVDSTIIRTPDTRLKSNSNSQFSHRNSRDEYDIFPNADVNPVFTNLWKPSAFYNNINWGQNDYNQPRIYKRPEYNNFDRSISDDSIKEFYCRKCRELNNFRGCGQQKSGPRFFEITTPKVKLDGKLAKLK